MIGRFSAAVGAALVFSVAAAYLSPAAEDSSFPHALHEGLFPNQCASCHGGIAAKNGPAFSVTPANCASCHDGDMLDPVAWKGPRSGRVNLIFDHALHVGEMEIGCADCHGAPGSGGGMAVKRAAPEGCLGCHEAPEHLSVEADCSTCHKPLIEAVPVSAERIAAFPKPADHEQAAFLFEHGKAAEDLARCATCHAREKCETCHYNAEHVELIQKLGRDPRVASLVKGAAGKWPRPANHDAEGWDMAHAEAAGERIQTCANCHSQNFCINCHDEPGPTGWEQLPKEIPEGN